MLRLAVSLILSLVVSAATAQPPDTLPPKELVEHDALRQLKADLTDGVNKRDYPAVQRILHKPFMATFNTQDSFTDVDKIKAFYDGLFTRKFLRMKEVSLAADADELSQIYEGKFAITRGSTKERYELADGRVFDMKGRWTGISMKENNDWKLLAVHMGINFLDNPVIEAVEKSMVWFAIGGAGGGLVVGLAIGWFVGRRRAA